MASSRKRAVLHSTISRRSPTTSCPISRALPTIRWSSMFRISLGLADVYRRGRVFIAGDAAPSTPDRWARRMKSSGIKDAYNRPVAKLGLVLNGNSFRNGARQLPEARSGMPVRRGRPRPAPRAASRSSRPRQEQRASSPRRRTTPGLLSAGPAGSEGEELRDGGGPAPGDRASRCCRATPLRCRISFAVVRHPARHRACAQRRPSLPATRMDLSAFVLASCAENCPYRCGLSVSATVRDSDLAGIALARRSSSGLSRRLRGPEGGFLIRPDGYVGWRGSSYRDNDLIVYIRQLLSMRLPA